MKTLTKMKLISAAVNIVLIAEIFVWADTTSMMFPFFIVMWILSVGLGSHIMNFTGVINKPASYKYLMGTQTVFSVSALGIFWLLPITITIGMFVAAGAVNVLLGTMSQDVTPV